MRSVLAVLIGCSASAATSLPASLNPWPQAVHSLSGTARSFSSSRYTNATNFIRSSGQGGLKPALYIPTRPTRLPALLAPLAPPPPPAPRLPPPRRSGRAPLHVHAGGPDREAETAPCG